MKYVHTNIISTNWQKLSDFYIAVFKCTPVPPIRNQSGEWLSRGTGIKNAALEGVHLRLPGHGDTGPTLEIYSYKKMINIEPAQANQQGIGHLAFEVEDVSKVAAQILNHGGSLAGEIVERHIENIGTITFVYARDPDGNLIELQHWDKSKYEQ